MILSLSPDVLDTVIFYGEDIAELAQLASQMFQSATFTTSRKQKTKTNLKTLVKQVKESLESMTKSYSKALTPMNLAKLVESLENE